LGIEKQKTGLVTGSAGFIGYHISNTLLSEGWRVVGLDCLSDYYDVSLKERREGIVGLVEKPDANDAPSNLASIVRYVPNPDIFTTLRGLKAGSGGEIQLADTSNIHEKQGSVETVRLNGRRFDCGSVGGFMQASAYEYEQRLVV